MRRALLALAMLLAAAARAEEPATRLVAIDWGLAETLVAIGAPPVGLAETAGYREWVREPALPRTVAEVGLRSTPSLEYLAALRPDAILSTPQFAGIEPVLAAVAPVVTLATFTAERTPLLNAEAAARALGALAGREAEAERLVTETEGRIRRLREGAGQGRSRPVLVVTFHDDRHLWVYGEGSLFGDVLARAGIPNAYAGETTDWGMANLSAERLADIEDAAVLIVEPVPPTLRLKLEGAEPDGLVGRMALFRPGAYRVLPAIWAFGGLPSAGRFADLLLAEADFLRAPDAP